MKLKHCGFSVLSSKCIFSFKNSKILPNLPNWIKTEKQGTLPNTKKNRKNRPFRNPAIIHFLHLTLPVKLIKLVFQMVRINVNFATSFFLNSLLKNYNLKFQHEKLCLQASRMRINILKRRDPLIVKARSQF